MDEVDEVEALRRRVADLERELAERTARANDAVAAAQDRSYWLDRWGVDLNALMRKRGAAELRAGIRAARALYRLLYDLRGRARGAGERLRDARAKLDEDRSR
jgi:Viral A-type inclusion protein repeat